MRCTCEDMELEDGELVGPVEEGSTELEGELVGQWSWRPLSLTL